MADAALAEMVPRPGRGRVFEQPVRAGLADAAPDSRVRLDALARWLQDLAYADVADAGVDGLAAWVVRRMRLQVRRFPRFGERLSMRTFCSGLGRMWAERRTTVTGAEVDVEAVALWIHLDPQSLRPVPLGGRALELFSESAAGRVVRARLHHPPPGEGARRAPWRFRASDLDVAGHVNNAAYWEPIEEELLAGPAPRRLDAEIEFRAPAQAGEAVLLSERDRRWIAAPDGELFASLLLS
jgi:acyl-ACP thioesterase